MRRSAHIQLRQGRLFVTSWSATAGRYPAFIQDEFAEAATEDVADEELGALARRALAASRDGVPYPDFRNDPEPARRRKTLFKLAGVRSETEFERATKTVSISWQDTDPEMRITPYRNAGRRQGFTQMLEQVITVNANADDDSLGAAVRQALMVATDGS